MSASQTGNGAELVISPTKKRELEEELIFLEKEKIPSIARRIEEAKAHGDLRENAEYHNAREDMAWAKTRLQEVDFILRNASILQGDLSTDRVIIGSTVVVSVGDKDKTYILVGAEESDPAVGKISHASPIGQALLGKKVGESVSISLPSGETTLLIKEIK